MKNTINKYIFYEFIRYFTTTLFALSAIVWTVQAVNFLDLVTEDGHAFAVYFLYSLLTLSKVLTKLIPFSFLIASILTILKMEKDNELIVLWTSGLNKIHIVNLVFRISILIMFLQFIMAAFISPKTLNVSRSLLKNSELQFVPSLLKERQFNDTVEHLTIFVDKKNELGEYENLLIRDENAILTQFSNSTTIFAKKGYVSDDDKSLTLYNGNMQKLNDDGSVSIIKFDKTELNLSGLSTKTISKPKIQETPTLLILQCMKGDNSILLNCEQTENNYKDATIEINKRLGTPFFIPLIGLITCFLLATRTGKKGSVSQKYIFGLLGVIILITSEITVRYSGLSFNHTAIYYLIPILLLPLVYFFLIKTFKYENLS